MSLGKVVKSSIWLYGSSITNNLFGFIYWFIISAIGGPEILGITSAVIGLAGLINGFLSFGLGIGLVRYIGKCIGERDERGIAGYFWSSLIFCFFVYLFSGLTLFLLGFMGYSFSNYTSAMLSLAGFSVMLAVANIFSSFLSAFLRTDLIFRSNFVGNVLKVIVGVELVLLGWGWIGAVIGYFFVPMVNLLFLSFKSFKKVGFRIIFGFKYLMELFKAGVVSWLPNIVALAGQWLGVLAIFGSSGAYETGLYYVAFSIANVVLMINTSLSSMLLPVLSGMEDGRKRMAWKVLKTGLIFSFPLAVFLFLYPWLPLGLLGEKYIGASQMLEILLLGLIPLSLTSNFNSLLYSYGLYRTILIIGLANNIPRVALYIFLVPNYGGYGAAISFIIGSFLGVFTVLKFSKDIGFKINYREFFTILVIPVTLGFLVSLLDLLWILGFILIYCFSILTYVKVGVIDKKDIIEILKAILPDKMLNLLRRREILNMYYKILCQRR